MPQYWVGIKDIALQPPVNSVLSFWITDSDTAYVFLQWRNIHIVGYQLFHYLNNCSGEVKFQKDQNFARTILYVDNSLQLYMFFDIYGSTQAIRLRGSEPVSRSHSALPRAAPSTSAPTRVALPPLPTIIRRENPTAQSSSSQPAEVSSNVLRVLLRDESNEAASNNNSVAGVSCEVPQPRPALPPRRSGDELLLGSTVNDLLTEVPALPRPPPFAPRTAPLPELPIPLPPSRLPPPIPVTAL
ncbi:hypothetical protein DICVIV_12273, partial [Dictyocaulus viviparus]